MPQTLEEWERQHPRLDGAAALIVGVAVGVLVLAPWLF